MVMIRVEQTTPQRPVNLLNGATYGVRTGIRHPLFAADPPLIVPLLDDVRRRK